MKKLLFALVVLTTTSCIELEKSANATINPTEGNTAKGRVTFVPVKEGVLIVAEVQGLTPGKHGFHIHEHGDCSAPDGSSAGGHFNPHGKPHGSPDSPDHHVGDLGNIVADEKGNATYEQINTLIELSGPNSIIGRAIIIHEKEDDYTTQPTGNAGNRVACGVIKPTDLPLPKASPLDSTKEP